MVKQFRKLCYGKSVPVMELLYTYYKKLVDTRGMLKKAVTGAEKMNLKKEIRRVVQMLDDIIAT